MTAYARCTVTGDAVSACCLDDRDAVEALGGSELLRVDTWMAAKAQFPARSGIGRRGVVRDLSWPAVVGIRLAVLEREFRAALG